MFFNNSTGTPIKQNENELLLIDNKDREHELASVIETTDSKPFEFQHIEALNHVTLEFKGHDELIAHKFSGDRTGRFMLKDGQKMYVEYVESEVTYTIAPVSFYTEAGSELVLPSDTVLLGTRTVIKGLMSDCHNLTIAEGAEVFVNYIHS